MLGEVPHYLSLFFLLGWVVEMVFSVQNERSPGLVDFHSGLKSVKVEMFEDFKMHFCWKMLVENRHFSY